MTFYLADSFSLKMLPGNAKVVANKLYPTSVNEILGQYMEGRSIKSFIRDQFVAELLASILKTEVPVNRDDLKVDYGDAIYVAQIGVQQASGQVLSDLDVAEVPLDLWIVTVL